MKHKKKVACAAIAVALMAAVFAGCTPAGGNTTSSTSSDSGSSTPEVSTSLPSEASSTPRASDEDFEKYFQENPVDKAYEIESESAYSNVDMKNLATKYSGIWQKEIDSAYEKLMEKATGAEKNQYDDEQLQWTSGKNAALEKISQDAQAEGGTMIDVTVANNTMNFYRDRAKQLYRELYNYDPAYAYAYTPEQS